MEKLDLKKSFKDLYSPPTGRVVEVEVQPFWFLMVDGQGDPNTSRAYSNAVEALFSLSYALKFAVKKGDLGIDYGVMPLEGLWWAQDMDSFTQGERSSWLWTMMIMQPDFVSAELVESVAAQVRKKKQSAALDSLRLERFEEGLSAQIMHVGPFADEAPSIERVHDFIEESGRKRYGKHHEIYLTDIRRADPAKWKTVIRQPMR